MVNKFNKYGCYICLDCGKKTRDTGNDEAKVELCRECYEKAQDNNRIADEGEEE